MRQEKNAEIRNSLIDKEFIALVLAPILHFLGLCFCHLRQLRSTAYLNMKTKVTHINFCGNNFNIFFFMICSLSDNILYLV